MAMKGQIVDASIINVPRQRNSREKNAEIKEGNVPNWSANKRRQKDVDARWTKKKGKACYGYKKHISVDVKYKFIRSFAVTDPALHDSQVFEQLLTDNTSKDIWADSAYRSEDRLKTLAQNGFRGHIQRKGTRNRKLTPGARRQPDSVQDPLADRTCLRRAIPKSWKSLVTHDRDSPGSSKNWFAQLGLQYR